MLRERFPEASVFNRLIDRIEEVAIKTRDPILLMGPTGAGKSQLARRIYAALSPGWDSAIPLDDVLRWLEDTGASAHNAQVVESADNRAAQALRAARPPRIVGRHP